MLTSSMPPAVGVTVVRSKWGAQCSSRSSCPASPGGPAQPLAAVGVAVFAAIVSSILDALSALGDYRRALPNHYAREWIGLFSPDADYAALLPGVLWALLYATVFIALGYRHFARKDVLS